MVSTKAKGRESAPRARRDRLNFLAPPSIDRLFSRTVCINLDRRPDRWRKMDDASRAWGCGTSKESPQWMANRYQSAGRCSAGMEGAYGCLRSHLSVIGAAARDGIDRLLVLEDDARNSLQTLLRGLVTRSRSFRTTGRSFICAVPTAAPRSHSATPWRRPVTRSQRSLTR